MVGTILVVTACQQRKVIPVPAMAKGQQSGQSPTTIHNPAEKSEAVARGPRPALLDDQPLLLSEGGTAAEALTGPLADNSRCYVCHLNYLQEELALTHARANIGCADCHGSSDAHIADESWSWGENGTPPDTMYPLSKLNPFCTGCHPKDKVDPKQHKAVFEQTTAAIYCTDCHGQHRLARRRCRWK
jgi:hypothetical protein